MRKVILETTEPTTLFLPGGFGYSATKARAVKVELGPYAQHQAAVFVTWTEKGKRKEHGRVFTGRVRGIIARGHDHPNQADAMKDLGGGCGMTRHASFSPEWDREFDEWSATAIPAAKRLLDLSQPMLSEEDAHVAG